MSMEPIEIRYIRPRFHRRVFANLLDIIIMAFLTVGLFLASRAIVQSTSTYIAKEAEIVSYMKDSGLYVVNEDQSFKDIVTYYQDDSFSGSQKKNGAIQAIDTFFAFAEEKCEPSDVAEMKESYDTYRLNPSFTMNGEPYFILSEGVIKENPDCPASYALYFTNVYGPYIDNYLQGYLITKVPGYLELAKFEALYLIFAEVLPAYAVAGLLTYLVPPLIFHRNRYTIGKLAYHVGLANNELLSVPLGRFLGRFCIFYFAELLLSLVTFGIPFIISFSLMAFSKQRQGFPDYLLSLHEVDLTKNRLYKSYEEIRLSGIDDHKSPVDFRMDSRKN